MHGLKIPVPFPTECAHSHARQKCGGFEAWTFEAWEPTSPPQKGDLKSEGLP